MKKIITSLLLTITLVISALPVSAASPLPSDDRVVVTSDSTVYFIDDVFASIDLNEEIYDAKMGKIDNNVSASVLQNIEVEAPDEWDVSYSVKNLGQVIQNGQIEGTLYMTTASSQKTKTATHDEDNVSCTLSVVWIDHWGPQNELVQVYGEWVTERTLYDREVEYYCGDNYVTKYPTSNSFSYGNLGLRGFLIGASSLVYSKGYELPIRITVTPSIID